ncbi:hypothetical protein M0813_26871 [Anaeramoeba flamelloides]|uniref:Uncharacterized protein n=1 Tax=Anaeramoeba flamelloides TaxID=1746091 RepID=A0ABQ8Y0V3_9EUKA|nr:hypothetical protein M0813_26871 [Anaeramoeba flamelloides]
MESSDPQSDSSFSEQLYNNYSNNNLTDDENNLFSDSELNILNLSSLSSDSELSISDSFDSNFESFLKQDQLIKDNHEKEKQKEKEKAKNDNFLKQNEEFLDSLLFELDHKNENKANYEKSGTRNYGQNINLNDSFQSNHPPVIQNDLVKRKKKIITSQSQCHQKSPLNCQAEMNSFNFPISKKKKELRNKLFLWLKMEEQKEKQKEKQKKELEQKQTQTQTQTQTQESNGQLDLPKLEDFLGLILQIEKLQSQDAFQSLTNQKPNSSPIHPQKKRSKRSKIDSIQNTKSKKEYKHERPVLKEKKNKMKKITSHKKKKKEQKQTKAKNHNKKIRNSKKISFLKQHIPDFFNLIFRK